MPMFETIKDEVIKRLESLNYKVNEDRDSFILKFIIDKVEQEIKNKTNQSEVPIGLHFVLVERVCGEFLKSLRASGMLSAEQIGSIVASIKVGDTNTSFDVNSSPQAKFDAYISYLSNYGTDDFAKFRRFVW